MHIHCSCPTIYCTLPAHTTAWRECMCGTAAGYHNCSFALLQHTSRTLPCWRLSFDPTGAQSLQLALLCIVQEKQAEHETAAAAQQQAAEEEDEDISILEVQRRANIKRNQQRMASMGLSTKSLSLPMPGRQSLPPPSSPPPSPSSLLLSIQHLTCLLPWNSSTLPVLVHKSSCLHGKSCAADCALHVSTSK